MKPVTGKVLKTIMFLVLAAIAMVVFVLFRQSKQFGIASVYLSHTNEVLYHNQKLLTALNKNESVLQDFAENVIPASSIRTENAESEIVSESEKLKMLTVDNPVQYPRTDSLVKLSRENKELINELFNQSKIPQILLTNLNIGKLRVNNIRRIADEIEHEEINLLTERKQIHQASEKTLMNILLLLIIIILVLIILIMRSLRIDFNALRKTEKERDEKTEEITYLSNLVEQTNDAIFSVDTNTIIKSWNKAAEKMYGYKREEAIGMNLRVLLQSRITEAERKNAIEELTTKGYYHNEYEYTNKNGESISVLSTITTLYDSDHNITGYVTIHRDITARKNLEMQLKKFNEALEEKVKTKTAELTEVFERITDAFIALDKDWHYTYMNKATGELIHRDPVSMIGKNVWQEFPDVVGSSTYMIFQQAMKEQKYMHNEDYYEPFDLWQENHVYPSPEGISVFIKNITERKKAEQEIIKEKNLSDSIINSLPGAFYLYNMEGKFLRWNKNFETVTNYTGDEILKMHPLDFFDSDEKEYLRSRIGQVFVNGVSDAEANFLTKNKKKAPYYFTGIKIEYEGQTCLMGVGIDVSSRVEAQKKIKQTSEQLRELAAHLQDVREEERASIAREIHDELGQQLTGLKMDVYWLKDEFKLQDEPVNKQIENIIQLLDTAINTVRRISSELRPPMIDDIGLIESLKWYAKEFQKRFNIEVVFKTDMDALDLSPKISIALFRIFQESLTNVARHASAKKVAASLMYENNSLVLRVADDGKGFDSTQSAKKKTLGLLGMKERALMINGAFEINGKQGIGTEVIATVHINADAEITL